MAQSNEFASLRHLEVHQLLALIHHNHANGLSTKAATHRLLWKLGKNPILFALYFEMIPTVQPVYSDELRQKLPAITNITEGKCRLKAPGECDPITKNTPTLHACITEHLGGGPYYPEQVYYHRDNSVFMAIRLGNCRMVQYYVEEEKVNLTADHAYIAAYFDQGEILEYLAENDCPIGREIFRALAVGGDHDTVLDYLLVCVLDTDDAILLRELVLYRRKKCFLLVISGGYCDDIDIHGAAIDCKSTEYLQLANDNGAPYSHDTCAYAAQTSTDAEMVRYLIDHGCPYEPAELYQHAALNDNVSLMRYLLGRGISLPPHFLLNICDADAPMCLRDLLQTDMEMRSHAAHEIIHYNSMKCLEEYVNGAGTFTQADYYEMVECGRYDMLLYLRMRGYMPVDMAGLRIRALAKNESSLLVLLSQWRE